MHSEDLPIFSISHNLLSNSNANERFPTLPKEELANLRSKNQKQNKATSESTKTWLKVFNEWRVQRNEARQLEDILRQELDAILCRFFAEIRKRDGDEYEPESLAVLQCSLVRHLKKKL